MITVSGPGLAPLVLLLQHELVIGRDCDGLIVNDSEVSRQHLRLRRRGEAVEVSDLQSTNGTFLDGARLTAPELVNEPTLVSIGDTTVRLEFPADRHGQGVDRFGRATDVRVSDDLRSTSIDLVARSMEPETGRTPIEGPGDTVTMVFSDIESSTERAAAVGDAAWFELLEEHNRLFRQTLDRWGGREVKSIGDGFMITFTSVRRALHFARDAQARVESEEGPDLRVRMGLHTGEAIADVTGDLFGRHVNLAARVANLAAGGQVLTSLVVHEIAMGDDDLGFGPPILAELKGFSEPETVYEFLWRDTES